MVFTFDLSDGFTDLARVRWEIGDTDEGAPIYQDEVLNALIAEKGDWQGAVIGALENIIANLLSTPNFSADWLKVDVSAAADRYMRLLDSKRTEYGLSTVTLAAGTVNPTRSDRDSTPCYDLT